MGGLFYLNLATLTELDGGKASIAFRRSLEDAAKDCIDRPMEKRVRKVVFELELTPMASEDPEFEGTMRTKGITGEFKIKTSIPNRKTQPYSFGLDRQGRLYFSQTSPTNVDQTTIDDIDPVTGKVSRGPVQEPAGNLEDAE